MFNAGAVSPAGAIGLMQVMPATGRILARAVGVRRFDPEMLERPDVNVHLGMKYLADQLRTWNGRVVPVLAAYNAGPARVQRWREFPEWGRDELFAERIPYQETRDYVKIVQRNAAMYRALYGTVVGERSGE
jgi:soluble lytic murein transglycosylase